MKTLANKLLFCAVALMLLPGAVTRAQTSAVELKAAAAKAPSTADLQKGDPGGTITGTINDVPASDSKAGVTLGDVANQVGQNKIGINFT
ncbi:MAG TPA: hypothetical protein VGS10_02970 [Terracidiphilus sp.]|nr:hypothetical protein [Terracidiphilus sp.]